MTKLWNAYQKGKEEVEDLSSIYDYGLCFDYVALDTFKDINEPYFRYQLSWGGPADEFRFFCGPDLIPYKIEFWFLDWFDGASRTLRGDYFKLLNEIFEWFKGLGIVEQKLEEARE